LTKTWHAFFKSFTSFFFLSVLKKKTNKLHIGVVA